jgi:transposase InsO family protein
LTDERIRHLERFSSEFRERQIDTRYTGDLMAVETYFVGALKGLDRIYLQSVINWYSCYAWGRLYTSKLPVTAVPVLNDDVLPFFDQHGVTITTFPSDNGREFCGNPDKHRYELFLQLQGIEHRTIRVGWPQSNDFSKRPHQPIKLT